MASQTTIPHPTVDRSSEDGDDLTGSDRTDVFGDEGDSVEEVMSRSAHVSPLASFSAASLDVDVGNTPADTDEVARETLEDFSRVRVGHPGGVCHRDRRMARQVASKHLDHSITVERFSSDANSNVPFHRRSAAKIRRFADDYLPRHSVYVLNAGESFRIRISIGRDGRLRYPLSEVVSVKVIPPDGEGQSVEIWQRNREYALDALGLIEPGKFKSERLNRKCPVFGLVDAKYVKLTVHVKFRLGDGFPYDMDVYPNIYLWLKRPPRLPNMLEKLREWKRAATNTSGIQHKLKWRQ